MADNEQPSLVPDAERFAAQFDTARQILEMVFGPDTRWCLLANHRDHPTVILIATTAPAMTLKKFLRTAADSYHPENLRTTKERLADAAAEE